MRLVAVADTHGREWLYGGLPDRDIFVHAGDLLQGGSTEELKVAAEWLRELPFGVKVVIAGNTDRCFMEEPDTSRRILGEDVIYLHDQGTAIAGLYVWGSPWQPEYRRVPSTCQGASRWRRSGGSYRQQLTSSLLTVHRVALGI